MLQRNVLEYLEASAKRLGDKIAFTDETGAITFGKMRDLAQRLGTCIAKQINSFNGPVAVMVNRRAESLTAMQGVLYSGNYYVPIDNKMPPARIRKILEQVKARVVICAAGDETAVRKVIDEINADAQSGRDCPLCRLISMEKGFEEEADAALLGRLRRKILDADPVYVLFTSGSTGAPKGIVISHRNLIDFTEWMTEFCGYTSDDIFGNQAPFYFDLSGKDIYQTLKLGATCHILEKKLFTFPLLLTKELAEKQITALNWATSAFHLTASSGALEKCAPTALRTAALGGEALQAKYVNIWKRAVPNLHIINLYGPTETTIDCTGFHLNRDYADEEPIPLGTACENKEIILLNEQLRPAAPGESGEICVRGIGIAKGYFGDWEKTQASFIQNPLNTDYPDLIYRTGDMAVERDGLLYFLARKDGQIKHMGYRIELGEIEVALHSVSGITAAICLYDQNHDRIHCIYSGSPDSNELAKSMRALVPKYMLPNIYVKLDSLPYNANGKVDRVRLKKEYIDEASNQI